MTTTTAPRISEAQCHAEIIEHADQGGCGKFANQDAAFLVGVAVGRVFGGAR
jgi:hypothetical protein